MGGALLLAAVSTEPPLADPLEFELLAFEGDVLRDALREHYEGLRTV